jgi:hypothetical protein
MCVADEEHLTDRSKGRGRPRHAHNTPGVPRIHKERGGDPSLAEQPNTRFPGGSFYLRPSFRPAEIVVFPFEFGSAIAGNSCT